MRLLHSALCLAPLVLGCGLSSPGGPAPQGPLPDSGQMTTAQFKGRVEDTHVPYTGTIKDKTQLLREVGKPASVAAVDPYNETWYWRCSDGWVHARIRWLSLDGRPSESFAPSPLKVEDGGPPA